MKTKRDEGDRAYPPSNPDKSPTRELLNKALIDFYSSECFDNPEACAREDGESPIGKADKSKAARGNGADSTS